MLDNTRNFSRVTLSTGYDNVVTSVVLTSGGGAKLPTAPFNLVWWNSTDFSDPSQDPLVEIVRCTNISTDTLTITRAQESTAAATHNTGGKTYQMIAGWTALNANKCLDKTGDTMTGALGLSVQAAPGSPSDGQEWYDSTQKNMVLRQVGANIPQSGMLYVATADKTVANTTTATSLFGTGIGTQTLPANYLVPGRVVQVLLRGKFSQQSFNSTGTIVYKVGALSITNTFGPAGGSFQITNSAGASTYGGLTTGGGNGELWEVEFTLTCRSTGVSGVVMVLGSSSFCVDGGTGWLVRIQDSSQFSTSTLNTTVTNLIDVTWAWGSANVSNTITSQVGMIEVKN